MFDKYSKKLIVVEIHLLDGIIYKFKKEVTESDAKEKCDKIAAGGFYIEEENKKRLYPPHMIKFIDLYEENK